MSSLGPNSNTNPMASLGPNSNYSNQPAVNTLGSMRPPSARPGSGLRLATGVRPGTGARPGTQSQGRPGTPGGLCLLFTLTKLKRIQIGIPCRKAKCNQPRIRKHGPKLAR